MENISPFIATLLWNLTISAWIISVILITKFFKNAFQEYLEYITAATVWLLLWLIFLGFLPEMTTEWWLVWSELWIFILIWIFTFYLLELFLHWHHCKDLWHETSCQWHNHEEHKNWILMFWWTMLHNSFHWLVLFSAFSLDFHFWIATTVAILLHSIPQNIANYVMNHKNIKYAYIAAFWWVLWVCLIFPFTEFLTSHEAYILAIISWWLLYTALADIFPGFKWKWNTARKFSYLFFILVWIALFLGFKAISEHSEHEDHQENEVHQEQENH